MHFFVRGNPPGVGGCGGVGSSLAAEVIAVGDKKPLPPGVSEVSPLKDESVIWAVNMCLLQPFCKCLLTYLLH